MPAPPAQYNKGSKVEQNVREKNKTGSTKDKMESEKGATRYELPGTHNPTRARERAEYAGSNQEANTIVTLRHELESFKIAKEHEWEQTIEELRSENELLKLKLSHTEEDYFNVYKDKQMFELKKDMLEEELEKVQRKQFQERKTFVGAAVSVLKQHQECLDIAEKKKSKKLLLPMRNAKEKMLGYFAKCFSKEEFTLIQSKLN